MYRPADATRVTSSAVADPTPAQPFMSLDSARSARHFAEGDLDVAALFAAGDFGARAMLRLTPWLAAGVRASGEIARVARASGHVTYASVGGSGVLAFVPIRRADLFELEVALEPRAGWARLDGGSDLPGVTVSALDSFLFEIDVTVAPTLVLDALDLALVLRAGVTIIGPTGRVGGEPSVAIPGFAAGASVRAGIR